MLANDGEFIDRAKQKFNMTQSDMNEDGDFEDIIDIDENPRYSESLNMLQQRRDMLLTLNDEFFEETDDSEESDEVEEMIHRSTTASKMLYQGAEYSYQSGQNDSQVSSSLIHEDKEGFEESTER